MKSLFVNYRTEIQENNSHLAFADSTKDAVRICEKLNGLQKENEELKSRCDDYDTALKTLQDLTDRKLKENEQLKQFPIKLDNRIQKLEEDLKALKEMETDDLNPQAIEDVTIVIGISFNALKAFKKELKCDVE